MSSSARKVLNTDWQEADNYVLFQYFHSIEMCRCCSSMSHTDIRDVTNGNKQSLIADEQLQFIYSTKRVRLFKRFPYIPSVLPTKRKMAVILITNNKI